MASMPYALLSVIPTRKPAAGEAADFGPRPGRAAHVRLRVLPTLPPLEEATTYARTSGGATWEDILAMRGELPAAKPPRAKRPAAHVPPYLRPGYWRGGVKLGSALHAAMREELGREARIRPCPASLAALLVTPEWKGATVGEPTKADLGRLKLSALQSLENARSEALLANGKANKARAAAHIEAHESRLARLHEARRVVHPSGAVLVWLPL